MHPHEFFGYLFDLGVDVLVTTLDKATGVVKAQLGDSTDDTPDSDNAEWWQHVGFTSRPARPTQGGSSCQACILRRSDRDIIFTTRDVRGTAILGNLADGESCVYASEGQARTVWKADGSVRAMTTHDNTAEGNAVWSGISSYYVDPPTQTKKPGGEWRVYAPWGGQWQDPSGWHLRTWHGVKLDAGGTGFPALGPLPPATVSSFTISADSLILDCAILQAGRDTGLASGGVQADQFASLVGVPLDSFMTAMSVYADAIASAAGVSGSVSTEKGLKDTALSAALSAIGNMVSTCKSRTTLA